MEEINPQQYYESRISNIKWKNDGETSVCCPFHDDKTPSMSLNKNTGFWFCHGACHEGGNMLEFEAKSKGISTKEAYKSLLKEYNLDNSYNDMDDYADRCHQELLINQSALSQLERERGIKKDVIKKYKIGLDASIGRLSIPIYRNGICVNIRKYKSHSTENKLIGVKGHNEPHLFPYANIKENTIYLMEGEMDCLLANQLGLNAITVTSGAGTWNDAWNDYFRDKQVVIIYDIDEAGRNGALKIAEKIKGVCSILKNVVLPIKDPPNGDFTDYIVTHGFDMEDLIQLIEDTPNLKADTPLPIEIDTIKLNLGDSSNAAYHAKYIEVPVTISGKDMETFNVPKKFKISCVPGGKKCASCKLCDVKEMTFEIDKSNENILSLIDINQFQLTGALRQIADVHCEKNTVEVIDKQSVEEVVAIPEIAYNDDSLNEYITRKLFYVGHGLKTNKSYIIKGYNYTNPKDQHATILFNKTIATQGTLDSSKLTPDVMERLKMFECEPTKEAIADKLKDIYDDFSYNVTHIFQRQDLLLAIDLTYHSVLSFEFCNIYVHKGWIDCLILGDTRCGKSKSIEGLVRHYRAGEIVGGDNISFAGLVGGVQQIGKGWVITWGKLALNNGMLVAIDEMSSMDTDQISLLSGIRTTGVAEIVKIRGGKTQSKTRLICFSNPRSGRKIAAYTQGVRAVKELIGKAEDVARFDFAITVSDTEIKQDEIDEAMMSTGKLHKYNGDDCHNLVLWAWTRKREHVSFEAGVEKYILKMSSALTDKYDSSIPLVTPAEQRIKLARMSIALAARLHSTDTTGEKIIVKECHVDYCYDYLIRNYNKTSMSYDMYSEGKTRAVKSIISNKESIIKDFTEIDDWWLLRNILLDYEIIKKNEIELQMKWGVETTKMFFGWVTKNYLMFSTHSGYAKHPSFIEILKDLQQKQTKDATSLSPIVQKARDMFSKATEEVDYE